jgi:hypothetical protein
VALHESFWVVAGAAAPVIALAEIVSLGDAYRGLAESRMMLLTASTKDFDRLWREMRPTDTKRRRGFRAGQLNMLLQVAILALALASLEVRRDVGPLGIITIVQPIGIFLLFISGWMINSANRKQQRTNLTFSKDPPAD